MRPVTAPERALLFADNNVVLRVMVANATGTMIDFTSSVLGATVSENVDDGSSTATVEFERTGLAPFINPAIDTDRKITIETSVVAPGAAAGTYKNVFHGYIDAPDWGDNPMTANCRGLAKKLLDTFIEVERPYGSDTPPGIAIQAVIQSIINDNAPPSPSPTWNPYPTLQVPVNPNAFLSAFTQAQTSVWEAIQTRALQIGWDLRYRYGTNALPLLTLYSIPRTSPTVMDTFGPSEYMDIPSLALDDENIRNYGEAFYDPNAAPATSFNTPSITKFGRRYMRLGGDAIAGLKTAGEAQAMINAAILDLAFPRAQQTVRMRYFWPVELQDFYGWAANAVHYTSQQNFAVAGFTHTFRDGMAETELRVGGNPAGAYDAWLRSGEIDLSGASVDLPEILTVSAPIPIIDKLGVISGYRISGRVDLQTHALIITLTTGLTLYSASPSSVTPTTGEYWLQMPPAGFFTIEVALGTGGTGTVTLVPASIYNPFATPPKGGTLGESHVQRLSRAPVTSIYISEPTLTTRQVTLTVRPSSATIKYRFAPLPTGPVNDPWVAVPATAGGTVTFVVDVSGSAILLEYFSVITVNAEEVHAITLDKDDVPSVTLSLAENAPNILTCSIGLDDDTVAWKLWAAKGLFTQVAEQDPQYLRATGNRDVTTVEFFASGSGGFADFWYCYLVGYDKNGRPSPPFDALLTMTGATSSGGGLSDLVATVGGSFLDIGWTHNAVIAAAAASRFQVRIFENNVAMVTVGDARSAKTDAGGSDTVALAGAWRRTITPSSQGAAGAVYLTLNYQVDLYDTGSYVATYSAAHAGWFIGGSTTGAPSGTPGASSLTNLGNGCVSASWSGSSASFSIEVEWHVSTDNFGGNDTIADIVVVAPSIATYTSCGYTNIWVRERRRFANAAGYGAFAAYSASVFVSGSPLP